MGIQLGGGSRRGARFRDINVTPLVDVMLVLLIVFMVTAPLLTAGLRIDLPEVKAAETPTKDTRLLVTVTKDERILLGERDITDRVADAFKESDRIQTEQELYIRADRDARYGAVATVVAAARNSGVQSLNLLVQPELVEQEQEESGPAPAPAAQQQPAPRRSPRGRVETP
jgi:biopolymer transport protein TolR